MAKILVKKLEGVIASGCDYRDSLNQKSCVLSGWHGMRCWKHIHRALLHPTKLARTDLSPMQSYENMRAVSYTYHHLFVVGGVHSLFPCPPSQGVPCNCPLFNPSSSTSCQVYCLSHSSLYTSHQDCVATCDPPNKAMWKKYFFSSSKHTSLPRLSLFCCIFLNISYPNNVQLNFQCPQLCLTQLVAQEPLEYQ